MRSAIELFVEDITQRLPALASRKDNNRPHTSIMADHKLQDLGLDALMRPSDLTTSYYQQFLFIANCLAGEEFASREAC